MSFKKQLDEILGKVNHSSFESVEGAMEKILDLLEANPDDQYVETAVIKAEQLKKEAASLLMNERASIVKLAKENGISISELGLDDFNDEDEEDEEEDEKENKKGNPAIFKI